MMNRQLTLKTEIERVDGRIGTFSVQKHRKMAASPFVFFRGSSQLFYADLASGVISLPASLLQLPLTAVMGDCHVSNFGMLTEEGSHGDSVVFAPNDFDDACIGHAVWDLLRYCVSVLLCQQHCEQIAQIEQPHVTHSQAVEACRAFLMAYQQTCAAGVANDDHLSQVLDNFEAPSALVKGLSKARKRAAGGAKFAEKSALAKSVDMTSEQIRFIDNSDKFMRLDRDLYDAIKRDFGPYMDDAILDIVSRQNAGTGSVNMQRYYCLVGPDNYAGLEDLSLCHIVEVKQQRQAAALYYFDSLSVNNQLNPAHLTVMCQRRMQRRADLVLDEVGMAWTPLASQIPPPCESGI